MTLAFEDFTLNIERRELLRDGQAIAVQPQVFDLLVYIIENRERVVTRDDLIEQVWNGRIVSESTLATRINAARNALNDTGNDQRLIRTMRGRGIRFVGTLLDEQEPTQELPPQGTSEKTSFYLPPITVLGQDQTLSDASMMLIDDLTITLTRFQMWSLIAQQPDPDAQNPGYCLTGTIRQASDSLRFIFKFTNSQTGALLWADQYVCATDQLDKDITLTVELIVNHVCATFNLDRSRQASAADDLSAYPEQLYYKARALFRIKTITTNLEAEQLLRRSIELRPDLPAGHIGISTVYILRAAGIWSKDTAADLEVARQAALAALNANESVFDPYIMLAFLAAYKRQYQTALDHLDTALRLHPSLGAIKAQRGTILSFMGKFDEAFAYFNEGQGTIADQKRTHGLNVGRAHFLQGNYEQATENFEQYVDLSPSSDLSLLFLGFCYEVLDRVEDAKKCVARQMSLCPFTTIERIALVTPYPEKPLALFNAFLRRHGVPEN